MGFPIRHKTKNTEITVFIIIRRQGWKVAIAASHAKAGWPSSTADSTSGCTQGPGSTQGYQGWHRVQTKGAKCTTSTLWNPNVPTNAQPIFLFQILMVDCRDQTVLLALYDQCLLGGFGHYKYLSTVLLGPTETPLPSDVLAWALHNSNLHFTCKL